ncbi:MAG: hypothetical protein VXZ38_06835 [Planctomycetota bacterium]|nr:hypothetical protein [Planctomycetota bacterium]
MNVLAIFFPIIVLFSGALNAGFASTIWLAPSPSEPRDTSWYPAEIQKQQGQVVQFDQDAIVIIDPKTSRSRRFASSRVLWIEADDQTDREKKIRSLFEERRDSDVLSGLSDVLNERPPVWRQQWLTMVAAVSAWRTKRGNVALELINQLDQRPLPLMTLAWLPIAWTNQVTVEPLVADALDRLSDSSPMVQLIASSWLLSSVHRNVASEKIKELITSERKEVAQLASALLWRVATPEQVKKSAGDWRKEIERMPLMLQSGPLVLLKSKLESSGEATAAEHLQWSIDVAPLMTQLRWLDGR